MVEFVGVIILVLVVVVLFQVVAARDRVILQLREQASQQGRDIAALRQLTDAIADRVLLTRDQRRVKWFDELPPIALDDLKTLSSGSERELIVAFGGSDDADVIGLHYRHDRLEFRSDGEKDAVAHGFARQWATIENERPVKIYVNQYALISKMVGLYQDGFVKFAPHHARLPE